MWCPSDIEEHSMQMYEELLLDHSKAHVVQHPALTVATVAFRKPESIT